MSLKLFGYTVLQLDRSNTILIKNTEYKNDLTFKKILDVFKIPHNTFGDFQKPPTLKNVIQKPLQNQP